MIVYHETIKKVSNRLSSICLVSVSPVYIPSVAYMEKTAGRVWGPARLKFV
jgi:hypothetical protein